MKRGRLVVGLGKILEDGKLANIVNSGSSLNELNSYQDSPQHPCMGGDTHAYTVFGDPTAMLVSHLKQVPALQSPGRSAISRRDAMACELWDTNVAGWASEA